MNVNLPQLLNHKYLEWQYKQGSKKTIEEFADTFGVSKTQRRAITAKLAQLQTLDLSHWLTTTAPGLVNQTLHTILTSITVGEQVSLKFR